MPPLIFAVAFTRMMVTSGEATRSIQPPPLPAKAGVSTLLAFPFFVKKNAIKPLHNLFKYLGNWLADFNKIRLHNYDHG